MLFKGVGMRELIIGGKYQHYKGNRYKVLCVAKHSETEEEMVVYQAEYGEKQIWARPLAMFLEKVRINGEELDRFRLVEGEE